LESISTNSLYQLALQRDRGWFKEYHEFATFASFTTTSIQGIRNDDHEDDDYEDDDENDSDSIAEQKEIKRKIIEQLQLDVGMHLAKVNIERLNALYGPLFSGDRNDVGSDKEKVQQTKDQLRTLNQIDGFFLAAENDIAESTRQNEDGNFSCFL